MRALQRFADPALTDCGHQSPRGRHGSGLSGQIIGCLFGLYRQDHVDIRKQSAGTDAEGEAAVQQMIQHGNLADHMGGVGVGQVYRARAKMHLRSPPGHGRDEQRRRCDVLGQIAHMFADITFGKAQSVGQQERLLILAQALLPILAQGLDRHGEEAKLPWPWPGTRPAWRALHVGMGVTKAATDAEALARYLAADDVGGTLAAYQTERHAAARLARGGPRLASYISVAHAADHNRDGRTNPNLARIMAKPTVVPAAPAVAVTRWPWD